MKNILLITDRKAGHENISKGIITEIKKYKDINIIEVEAKLYISNLKHILKFLINNSLFWYKKSWFIKLFYKQVNILNHNKDYDLIISTGGTTSFLNIMLSKYFECPNIYCSSLRGLNYNYFTHVISIEKHDFPNEIVLELAPVNLIYNQKNIQKFKDKYQINSSIISFLIGGKTKYYQFSTNEVIDITREIISLAKRYDKKLLITTSRRTSLDIENQLNILSKEEKNIVQKCICYNTNPEKVMSILLYLSEVVFVTEDSGSMISEAILSQKRVYTIEAKKTNIEGIYKNFIDKLKKNNRVVPVKKDEIKCIDFNENINPIEKLPSYIVYKKIEYLL